MFQLGSLSLRPCRAEDAPSVARNIHNRKIYQATTHIPYPYTLADAEAFLARMDTLYRIYPNPLTLAIAEGEEVVGMIGYGALQGHQAELGYWIAEPYWGKSLMPQAVELVTKYAFDRLGVVRSYATVFHWNRRSARVLEKAGYTFEGTMRKSGFKDGQFIDRLLYAKVKE